MALANPTIKSNKVSCDQKLTMHIVLRCCQSAVSCVLFIDIPFCEDTVLPLTILSGTVKPNQECQLISAKALPSHSQTEASIKEKYKYKASNKQKC